MCDAMTKDMDQLHRQNVLETIYIKDLKSQRKRRAPEAKMILEKEAQRKNLSNYGVEWKTN